jgi:hypothetical protein
MNSDYNVLISASFADVREGKFGEQIADAGLLSKATMDYVDTIEELLSIKEDGTTICAIERRNCWLVYDRLDEFWYFVAAIKVHPDLTNCDVKVSAKESLDSVNWPIYNIKITSVNCYYGLQTKPWLEVRDLG